jgi:pyridoxal phosphate enzyme (YggS family)
LTSWVAANLAAVRLRIEQACRRVDRDPAEVRLLPVSKTHGPDVIGAAYEAGVRLFGENRVQELAEKAEALADRTDLGWALIGHLQSNKARQAAKLATEFHALDSTKVAYAMDRRLGQLGRSLDVFIQVNSSQEPQKAGLPPEEVLPFARELGSCASLRVRGLMTLAVFSDDAEAVGACFERTRQVQRELRDSDGLPGSYDELSMGMSGDFELAIQYGATTVRVGQAIFGPR